MFRRITMGKPVIMGRRTWQSLTKALDGRDNIVISREAALRAPGAIVATTVAEALALAEACAERRNADEIMVIGGAEIFAALMHQAQRIYWTDVEGSPDGDTFFPALSEDDWREVSRERLPRSEKDEYGAVLRVLERRS